MEIANANYSFFIRVNFLDIKQLRKSHAALYIFHLEAITDNH